MARKLPDQQRANNGTDEPNNCGRSLVAMELDGERRWFDETGDTFGSRVVEGELGRRWEQRAGIYGCLLGGGGGEVGACIVSMHLPR